MDCIDYRDSGELSDICIIVDQTEFHLHKFPLFVRSNYFKNLSTSDPSVLASASTSAASLFTGNQSRKDKLRIRLDNFPGGSKVFALIADYCYNKEIHVDVTNVIYVKCAAEYLQMNSNGKGGLCMLADNILFDLLYVAQKKRNYKLILQLTEQAMQYKEISEKSKLNLRLLDAFIDNLASAIKIASAYNLSKLDFKQNNDIIGKNELKILNNLPLYWFVHLIKSKSHASNFYQNLLSHLIENYIDYNTNLNPSYKYEIDLQLLQPLLQPLQIDVQNGNDNSNFNNANTNSQDVLSLIKTSSPAVLSPATAQSQLVLTSNSTDLLTNDNLTSSSALLQQANEALSKQQAQSLSIDKPKELNDKEKIEVINTISLAFNEAYIDNQLAISWLLTYAVALNSLNADNTLKLIFIKWIWNALSNLKNASSDELVKIPPDIMIELVNNIASAEDATGLNLEKVLNFVKCIRGFISFFFFESLFSL